VEQFQSVDGEISLLAQSNRRAPFLKPIRPFSALIQHRAQNANHHPPLFHALSIKINIDIGR
jgi:hypothetical protein